MAEQCQDCGMRHEPDDKASCIEGHGDDPERLEAENEPFGLRRKDAANSDGAIGYSPELVRRYEGRGLDLVRRRRLDCGSLRRV